MKVIILFLFGLSSFACQSKKRQIITAQFPIINIYPNCIYNIDSVYFYYPIKIENLSMNTVFFDYSSNELDYYNKNYNKVLGSNKWVQIDGDTYQGRWRSNIQEFKLRAKEAKSRLLGVPRYYGDYLELIFHYKLLGEFLHTRVFLEIKEGYIIRQLDFYEVPLDIYFEKKIYNIYGE